MAWLLDWAFPAWLSTLEKRRLTPALPRRHRPAMAFWREKSLAEMTVAEWEQLCDGCGLCCQIRVEDEDSGEIALSDAACRLLDLCTHRCSHYGERQTLVPDCVKVTPENVRELTWLPHSCAYRLVAYGFDLPAWHHLVCGDRERVHTDGPSMRGELVSEDEVDWDARYWPEDA